MRKVYLISSEQNGETLYKIGFTKRAVEQRIREFKTGNSSNFDIVHVYEPENYAVTIERKLHRAYSDKHINGEWFRLSSHDIDRFTGLCAKFYDECKLIMEYNTYMQDMNYYFK